MQAETRLQQICMRCAICSRSTGLFGTASYNNLRGKLLLTNLLIRRLDSPFIQGLHRSTGALRRLPISCLSRINSCIAFYQHPRNVMVAADS